MDVISKKQRSYIMSRIRGKNTKPELMIRKMLSSTGIRGYRLHSKVIGSPDVYFPKRKIAIFIDGCFWHGCRRCFRKPKSNTKYWNKKISDNVARDKRNKIKLGRLRIRAIHIWEHQIRANPGACYMRISGKLSESRSCIKYPVR